MNGPLRRAVSFVRARQAVAGMAIMRIDAAAMTMIAVAV
jgi:hypothetical protein